MIRFGMPSIASICDTRSITLAVLLVTWTVPLGIPRTNLAGRRGVANESFGKAFASCAGLLHFCSALAEDAHPPPPRPAGRDLGTQTRAAALLLRFLPLPRSWSLVRSDGAAPHAPHLPQVGSNSLPEEKLFLVGSSCIISACDTRPLRNFLGTWSLTVTTARATRLQKISPMPWRPPCRVVGGTRSCRAQLSVGHVTEPTCSSLSARPQVRAVGTRLRPRNESRRHMHGSGDVWSIERELHASGGRFSCSGVICCPRTARQNVGIDAPSNISLFI